MRHFRATEAEARSDARLTRFLRDYQRSFFDWGDDPGFSSALDIFADARAASWGVCRPDVRAALIEGDFVVFFCARLRERSDRHVDYYFVGVGTVARLLDRQDVWTNQRWSRYRGFYNILAELRRGRFAQREVFHPHHDNWRDRLKSPYVLFDQHLSAFNLRNPLHVASFLRTPPESWRSRRDERVRKLEELLFCERGIARRLRTAARGHAHSN